MELQVKLLSEDARLPGRFSTHAAGYDLYSIEDINLASSTRVLIKTGVSIAIPEGHYGIIKSRSSIAMMGLDIGAGVIDADYRGEVRVLVCNNSPGPIKLPSGTRIAQLIIQKYETPLIKIVDELPSTVRGDGGFGSTGKN